jgi:hypothetical protein
MAECSRLSPDCVLEMFNVQERLRVFGDSQSSAAYL